MARVPITAGIRRWAEYEGKDDEALRDLCTSCADELRRWLERKGE